MIKRINHQMKVVSWLRKTHSVLFPKDRNSCSFLLDGEKVILVVVKSASRDHGHKDKTLNFDIRIAKQFTNIKACDWIYLYFPFIQKKPLYQISIPLLIERKRLYWHFSISKTFETKYPLEFIDYLEKRGTFEKRDKNGRFASSVICGVKGV